MNPPFHPPFLICSSWGHTPNSCLWPCSWEPVYSLQSEPLSVILTSPASVSNPFPSFRGYLGFWLLREPFTFTLEVAYRSPDSLSLCSSNLPRTLSITVSWHQAFLVPKFILESPLPTQQSTNSKQGPQLHFFCVTRNLSDWAIFKRGWKRKWKLLSGVVPQTIQSTGFSRPEHWSG